jgi:Reverse transcriptase (RNA-dependent DNA polymerase)
MAVQHGLKLHQMDIITAFLNGKLKEEVYMRQPECFISQGQEHLVCRLKWSIYGLEQSSRRWNSALDCQLKEMGFLVSG